MKCDAAILLKAGEHLRNTIQYCCRIGFSKTVVRKTQTVLT